MEDFVTFEIAKKLKEKGFKEKCYAYYSPVNNELHYNIYQFRGGSLYDCLYSYNSLRKEVISSDFIDAPTIAQVLKWLRDEKGTHINVVIWEEGWYVDVWVYEFDEAEKEYSTQFRHQSDNYKSHEQAVLAGIEYVINNNLI